MDTLYVFIEHRGHGLQLPLRANDEVRLMDQRNEIIGSLTGETLRVLIVHHLAGARLIRTINKDLERVDRLITEQQTRTARKPPAKVPFDREERAALKKRRARRSLVLVACLLLTGCMATSPTAWKAVNEDKFKADSHYCKHETNQTLWQGAYFGGAIVPLVALFSARGMYKECMEARGWTPAE